jgi:Fungal specific transcription factor domain
MSTKTQKDSTSEFLEQELFIANTFASTTNFLNFTLNEDFKLNTETPSPSSIFIEFLKLLQMVTCLERQARTSPEVVANSGVSPAGLRKLFEHARSRTLAMNKTFQVSGSHDYVHVNRTVNCFYRAGLIYSYRALLKDEALELNLFVEKDAQIRTSKFELFHALGFAETNKPTFAQDLVWPLFIAGTEATQCDQQRMVIAKLQQAMSETGFSNCQHAVEFLNALWQERNSNKEQETDLDWIAFAREWTGQGKTFLVF